MTTEELAVSFLCTVAGYSLVSWLLNRSKSRDGMHDDTRYDSGRDELRPELPGRAAPRSPPPRPGQEPWHRVLAVSPNATRAEIVAAYRALISQYHPDKVTQLGAEIRAVAERKSAEINRAYEQALSARPDFP